MALPIRDGNQSLTTLSTILVSNAHIPAHTVVSLGTQAITDISTAVRNTAEGTVPTGGIPIMGYNGDNDTSFILRTNQVGQLVAEIASGTVTVGNTVTVSGTVTIGNTVTVSISGTPSVTFGTAVITGSTSILNFPATQTVTFVDSSLTNAQLRASAITIGGTVTANAVIPVNSALGQSISDGDVTLYGVAIGWNSTSSDAFRVVGDSHPLPISGTVTANVSFASTTATFPSQLVALGFQDHNTGNVAPVNSDSEGGLPAFIKNISVEGNPATVFPNWLEGINPPKDVPISGTVTANLSKVSFEYGQSTTTANGVLIGWESDALGVFRTTSEVNPLPIQVLNSVTISSLPAISGTVTIGSALPAGTNRIGVVTIGAGTVTIGAGTAQIGSVTASGTVTANLSNTVTASWKGAIGSSNAIPIVFAQEGVYGGSILGYDGSNTSLNVNIKGSLPSLVAGTAQIGSVTVGNTVTIANIQGTTVTTSNFTSTTPSTVLAGFNATREVLTVFNEGAGLLYVSVGTSCTTIGYQVRLSSGDYYEAPLNQASITHSAVFATAGTARVTQVS